MPMSGGKAKLVGNIFKLKILIEKSQYFNESKTAFRMKNGKAKLIPFLRFILIICHFLQNNNKGSNNNNNNNNSHWNCKEILNVDPLPPQQQQQQQEIVTARNIDPLPPQQQQRFGFCSRLPKTPKSRCGTKCCLSLQRKHKRR